MAFEGAVLVLDLGVVRGGRVVAEFFVEAEEVKLALLELVQFFIDFLLL